MNASQLPIALAPYNRPRCWRVIIQCGFAPAPMKLVVALLVTFTVLCAGQLVRSSLSEASSVRDDIQVITDPSLERVRS